MADSSPGQYLGNQERMTTIEKMQKLVDEYPQDFLGTEEEPEKNTFSDNMMNFWGALRSVVVSPFQRIETERRAIGRNMGQRIKTLRELSEQQPYGEENK